MIRITIPTYLEMKCYLSFKSDILITTTGFALLNSASLKIERIEN